MRRVLAIAAALLVVAVPAYAAPQDVANEISREMMSPYCPGVTLQACPSEASRDLRLRIAGWAERGMSKAAIWERLEAEFGSDIRATPGTDGSGLWAWVLPIGATLAGIALAVTLALRWSRRRAASPETATPVTQQQRLRLERELSALRERQG